MSRKIRSVPRPSASLVIALVALFCALGGVGWAAIDLPKNSVGTRQLRKNAVTYKKIRPGSVGIRRINSKQVQSRVLGACATGSAIGSIRQNGSVGCNTTAPREFGASGTHTVGSVGTSVASRSLGTGAYMVFANPYATFTGMHSVTCTLSASNANGSQTRTVQSSAAGATQVAIPLEVPIGVKSPGGTVQLICQSSGGNVSVVGTLHAVQTLSNG